MFDITCIHFYFKKYVTNYKIYIKVVAVEEPEVRTTEFLSLQEDNLNCKEHMALGSTQPQRKRVPGIFPGSKEWPARKADNLTAICVPTV
jgi:hypothetical protein